MSKLPDALPEAVACPDKPPLHLKGGYLCVAAPMDFTEACFSAPAVRALKNARPQGTLAIVCTEEQVPLWQLMPQVDQVISYPVKASSRQIAKLLSESDTVFESSIVWEAGEAAKALARAGILQRFGYPAKGLGKFLTDPVEIVLTPAPIEHRVRHYLNFIQKLGVKAYKKENFSPGALKPPPEKLRIAIAPASSMGESYEWSLERFAELVEVMNERYGDVDWVILGDGSSTLSQARCSELQNQLGESVKDYSAEWGMRELLAALPHCSALLACDSETAHLAAHVGLPAAVIFGPNEPDWKRPLGKQSRVIREHVACSPCFESKCPLDMRCQEQVSVEMVTSELEKALAVRYGS